MKIHRLITFLIGTVFHESGPLSFDLHTTAGLLLNVLYICTARANYLCTKVEPGKRFQSDLDPLFGPFALQN